MVRMENATRVLDPMALDQSAAWLHAARGLHGALLVQPLRCTPVTHGDWELQQGGGGMDSVYPTKGCYGVGSFLSKDTVPRLDCSKQSIFGQLHTYVQTVILAIDTHKLTPLVQQASPDHPLSSPGLS